MAEQAHRPKWQTPEQIMQGELLHACRLGPVGKVQELVKAGAKVSGLQWHGYEPPGSQGTTALHKARGAEVTQFLIDAGADVNEPDGAGNTPLIEAVEWRDREKVSILLDHGAKTDVLQYEVHAETDIDGGYTGVRWYTPGPSLPSLLLGDTSSRKPEAGVIEEFIKRDVFPHEVYANPARFQHVLNYQEYEVARLLILNGADVNAAAQGETTPLRNAIQRRSTDTIRFLLENKAIVQRADLQAARKRDKKTYKFVRQTMRDLGRSCPRTWWWPF
jgi:hypothetical protein